MAVWLIDCPVTLPTPPGQRMLGHDWQPAAGTVVDIRVKHPNCHQFLGRLS
jgi:hypothetical protein